MGVRKAGLVAVAMLLALGQAGSARAGYVTGGELLGSCRPARIDPVYRLKVAECRGYVVGVSDSFDCRRHNQDFSWENRSRVSQEELVNVVIAWLESHPETHFYQADGLVAAALSEAFPCGQQAVDVRSKAN